ERYERDTFAPVMLWHNDTIRAMGTTRGTVIPELLTTVTRAQLNAAGFLGLMARSEAMMSKEGMHVFSEETDSELTITARSSDGTNSGWGGQAARNWSTIRPSDVVAHAIDIARQGRHPVAVEPGRCTAILSPAAG